MNQDQLPSQSQPPVSDPFNQQPGSTGQDQQPSTSNSVASHLSRYGVVAAAAVLLLLAGGVTLMALTGNAKQKNAGTNQAEAQTQPEAIDSDVGSTGDVAEIDLTGNGVTPDSLAVTPGTTVVWKNSDAKVKTVSGDLIGDKNSIDKDSSFSFVYSQPGDYTFTDGTHQGTITVKE